MIPASGTINRQTRINHMQILNRTPMKNYSCAIFSGREVA
jgi:hypothetical protein